MHHGVRGARHTAKKIGNFVAPFFFRDQLFRKQRKYKSSCKINSVVRCLTESQVLFYQGKDGATRCRAVFCSKPRQVTRRWAVSVLCPQYPPPLLFRRSFAVIFVFWRTRPMALAVILALQAQMECVTFLCKCKMGV